jgi:hypothetical protein
MSYINDPFAIEFEEWLAQAVKNGVPESVRAFSLNLSELAHVHEAKFAVEFVGTSAFSATGSDWACEENWHPIVRVLKIPNSISGDTWGSCLSVVQSLIRETLEADSELASILKSREGVSVGFVDGGLHILWP